MLLVMTVVGCKPEVNGPAAEKGELSGEWVLTSWNEATPEFHVYIDFNADGTFAMYQQVLQCINFKSVSTYRRNHKKVPKTNGFRNFSFVLR